MYNIHITHISKYPDTAKHSCSFSTHKDTHKFSSNGNRTHDLRRKRQDQNKCSIGRPSPVISQQLVLWWRSNSHTYTLHTHVLKISKKKSILTILVRNPNKSIQSYSFRWIFLFIMLFTLISNHSNFYSYKNYFPIFPPKKKKLSTKSHKHWIRVIFPPTRELVLTSFI